MGSRVHHPAERCRVVVHPSQATEGEMPLMRLSASGTWRRRGPIMRTVSGSVWGMARWQFAIKRDGSPGVEHPVDQPASDDDVEPDGERESGDRAVPGILAAKATAEGDQRHGPHDRRQDGV